MAHILMVGVLDVESSTNVSMARGFEELGHKVTAFNYRTVLKECDNSPMLMGAALLDFVSTQREQDFDLVVLCKTDTLPVITARILSARYKTFYYFMDPLATAFNFPSCELASACHYCSATTESVLKYFRGKSDKCSLLLEGIDTSKTYKKGHSKKYDVTFIGSADKKRIRILSGMETPVKVWGTGWPAEFNASPPIYLEEWNNVVNNSRVSLNITRGDGFSSRIFDIMSTGTFVLSTYNSDIQLHLNKNLMDWCVEDTDFDKKCNYYLSNIKDREEKAKQGYYLATNKYQWKHICSSICVISDVF